MIINNNNKVVFPAGPYRDGGEGPAGMNVNLHGNKNDIPVGKGEADRLNDKKRVEASIERFMNRTIRLEVDNELHRVIVKIVDKKSGEVIRQIPPEELVELARKMRDREGVFLDREV